MKLETGFQNLYWNSHRDQKSVMTDNSNRISIEAAGEVKSLIS